MEAGVKLVLTVWLMLASVTTGLYVSASCDGLSFGPPNAADGNTLESPRVTNQAYLMLHPSFNITCCGYITSWEARIEGVAAVQTLTFQVWRLVSGNQYTLVGQNSFDVGGFADDRYTFTPDAADYISVIPDDDWGWWTLGEDIVAYKGTGGGRADNNFMESGFNAQTVGYTHVWGGVAQTNRDYDVTANGGGTGNTPRFTNLPDSATVHHKSPAGTFTFTVSYTDDDASDIPFLVVTMVTTTSEFNFDTASGNVTVGTLTTQYGDVELQFSVTDPCGLVGVQNLTVNIFNPVPEIHGQPTSFPGLSEDSAVEVLLFTINVTDIGDTINCFTPPDWPSDYFEIRFQTGTLYDIFAKSNAPFDYSNTSSFTLEPYCNDTAGQGVSGTYFVYLSENQRPVITNLQNSTSILSSAPISFVVFNVTCTDADGDNLRFSMTCDVSCAGIFTIQDSGGILLLADLSSTTTVGYDIDVTCTDDRNNTSIVKTLTVTIADINDPVVISNLPLPVSAVISVSENTPLGDLIFTVLASDDDVGQAHTWTMTSLPNTGMTYFSIDANGNINASGAVLNYESLFALSTTSFTFTISVADPVTSSTQNLTIEVVNVNEAPTFSHSEYGLSTDESATIAGTPNFGVVDPDLGDTFTLSLDCHDYASYFRIDTTSGEVTFQRPYDLDPGVLPTSVLCLVTATDADGLSATANLTIAIAYTNDYTPIFLPKRYTFIESYYANVNDVIGTVTAVDSDIGTDGDVTFFMNQTNIGVVQFGVDTAGQITWLIAPGDAASGVNYSSVYTFELTATDTGGLTDTATVVIVILGLDESTDATLVRFVTFFESRFTLAWFVPCMVLLAVTAGFTAWVACTCHGDNGLARFRSKLKNHSRKKWMPNAAPAIPMKSVRTCPPPLDNQQWRREEGPVTKERGRNLDTANSHRSRVRTEITE